MAELNQKMTDQQTSRGHPGITAICWARYGANDGPVATAVKPSLEMRRLKAAASTDMK